LGILSNLIISVIIKASMYTLMGMGLALVFGVMKISNFAHGECYMMGAYIAYVTSSILKLGAIPTIIIAPVAAFFIGILIEKITFAPLRKHNKSDWLLNTFLLTAGLQLILQNIAQLIFGGQYLGVQQMFNWNLKIGGLAVSGDRVVAVIVSFVTIGAFWWFMKKTKTGNAITAVSQNETGAIIVGVNIKRIHSITFALSTALAAVAGASLISVIPAYPTMGTAPLLKSWSILILVGLNNTAGTLLGGFIVAAVEVVSVYLFGTVWQESITFIMIIIVLIFKPNGIFGKSLKV